MQAGLAMLAAAIACHADGPPLRPAWSHTAGGDIESFQIIALPPASSALCTRPAGDSRRIIYCDASGRVVALDAGSGREAWHSGSTFAAGVRLGRPPLPRPLSPAASGAAEPASVDGAGLCVFDRDSIGVIELDGGALRWKVGGPSYAPAWERDEDPEYLARLVAVAAVDDGVLAVRDDGAAALLAASDGKPRWAVRLEPRGDYVAHVQGRRAALVSRLSGQTRVLWLSWDGAGPRVRPAMRLDWSASWSGRLGDGSIALAGAERLARVTADGVAYDVQSPDGVLTGTVRLVATDAGERLVFVDRRGAVRANDAETGRREWGPVAVTGQDASAAPESNAPPTAAFLLTADRWIVAGTGRAVVLDARDGRSLGAPPGVSSPRIAFAAGDELALLGRMPSDPPDRLTLDRFGPPSAGSADALPRLRRVEFTTELPAAPRLVEIDRDLLLVCHGPTLACLRLSACPSTAAVSGGE